MGMPSSRENELQELQPLREAKRQLTRDRLIAAATVAFESKHYGNVTVDDISRRAGTSRATFYIYYPSKVKVLLDCLSEFETGLSELWDEFAKLDKKTVETLEDWLRSYIELYEKHKLLLGTLHEAEAVEPELLDNVVASVKNTIARWQQLGVVSSQIEPGDDLELSVLLFSAQIQRFLYLWIIQGIEVNREKAVRKLAQQWYDIIDGARSSAQRSK
jgi:AcrR family transcriptional regulator